MGCISRWLIALAVITATYLVVDPIHCQDLGEIFGLDVQFDENLFRATVPSVMEVGRPYTIRARISNNGTATGTFFLVVQSETSAIYPQIANSESMLRPGQTNKVNFTLLGTRPTEDSQRVRVMIFASPGMGVPPMKIWETDVIVRRIENSSTALPAVLAATMALLLFISLMWWRVNRNRSIDGAVQSQVC